MEDNGTTPSTQTSIRDTISEALDKVEKTQATEVKTEVKPETQEAKEQRLRDEQGKFVKGEKEVTPEPKPRPQRPSSWKKDYWPHWDKLSSGQQLSPEEALAVAEYTAQREQDFTKGVSTYKAEWDKAKPVLEVLNPISPMVQKFGFTDTNHWLTSAVTTFRALTSGTSQQKLGTLFQLASQYQVPLEDIFDQSEDGRWYLNPQKFQSVQPQQTVDVRKTVQEILQEERVNSMIEQFKKDEKFPHFDQVRETMAGLLRAGLVEDLPSAYLSALNMPQHSELKASIEQAKQSQDEAKRLKKAEVLAVNARAKVISPKSNTPVQQKTERGKGIRSTIEEAFNKQSGRV